MRMLVILVLAVVLTTLAPPALADGSDAGTTSASASSSTSTSTTTDPTLVSGPGPTCRPNCV